MARTLGSDTGVRVKPDPSGVDARGATVQIGEETQAAEIRGASVVSSQYGAEGQTFGGMGVLGPTRMDYPGTIASVAAVAHYVGELITGR